MLPQGWRLLRSDEELLPLSGLQHVQFCTRQFALIHLDGAWHENYLTAHGRILHENAHDPFFTEKRRDIIITRSVPVISHGLGVAGEVDVVEFHRAETGIELLNKKGRWRPVPIEYKRGKKKSGIEDEVQLCAQAMCLEEMMGIEVQQGYLFYWETRTRLKVEFSNELRESVVSAAGRAHRIIAEGKLPNPDRPLKRCRRCSLIDECLPESKDRKKASSYLQRQIKLCAETDIVSVSEQ
jgi:CRISPR-associated exonuclease Cas4